MHIIQWKTPGLLCQTETGVLTPILPFPTHGWLSNLASEACVPGPEHAQSNRGPWGEGKGKQCSVSSPGLLPEGTLSQLELFSHNDGVKRKCVTSHKQTRASSSSLHTKRLNPTKCNLQKHISAKSYKSYSKKFLPSSFSFLRGFCKHVSRIAHSPYQPLGGGMCEVSSRATVLCPLAEQDSNFKTQPRTPVTRMPALSLPLGQTTWLPFYTCTDHHAFLCQTLVTCVVHLH